MVLSDFLRGKLPWYTPPPVIEDHDKNASEGIEGRKGALGEMGAIRKRVHEATPPNEHATSEGDVHERPAMEQASKKRKKG